MLLTIEKLIILKSIKLFSQIPEKELIWLASEIKEISYEAQKEVIQQGNISTSMFIIIEGEMEIIIDDIVTAKLGKNDFFGELAVLDSEPNAATIKTITQTSLFKIDREIIYDLVNEYQNIAQGIIKVLCQQIRQKSS